ncbi:MAG: hypothetical protein FJY66_01900 [Calditrichaeota bacterium]|nr:hypothetical protein [Calditrichota bacterium]
MLQCLFSESFPRHWTDVYLETWKREADPSPEELVFFDEALRSKDSLLYACYDERFLGHVACKSQSHENEVRCQLRVLPSLVSRGIEEQLLSSIFDLAVFKGWTHISFVHPPTATPTSDFLFHLGGISVNHSNEILLSTPQRPRRLDTMGSLTDALIVTNMQMWHVQEKIYEPETIEALSKAETLHLLHRGTWLNLERNRCMDSLDKALGRILLPTSSEKAFPEEPLSALLARSRALLHDFIQSPRRRGPEPEEKSVRRS